MELSELPDGGHSALGFVEISCSPDLFPAISSTSSRNLLRAFQSNIGDANYLWSVGPDIVMPGIFPLESARQIDIELSLTLSVFELSNVLAQQWCSSNLLQLLTPPRLFGMELQGSDLARN